MLSTQEAILQIFVEIDENDHFEKVLFIERNQNDIVKLEEDQQAYLKFHYYHSLHEIGKYQKVVESIDFLIEYVFLNNKRYEGESAFEPLLFIKAKSLRGLLRYDESIGVLEQLIGIQPFNTTYTTYLQRVYLDRLNFNAESVKMTAVVLIFVSALICGSYWLIKSDSIQQSNIPLFLAFLCPAILALVLLTGNFVFNRFKSKKRIRDIVKRKKIKYFE